MSPDKNCFSYWYPRLLEAGVPTPQTEFFASSVDVIRLLDGQTPDGLDDLVERIDDAARKVGGYPVFLRTGQGSAKHNWRDTCFLPSKNDIQMHVALLAEWSMMADFIGLPTDIWVVRKLLPLHHLFTAFNGFPVSREFRFFIGDGRVLCRHPYWPEDAVAEGHPSDPDWKKKLVEINSIDVPDSEELFGVTRAVAFCESLKGDCWSLDIAQTASGTWFVLDMALAGKSYHAPVDGAVCPVAAERGWSPIVVAADSIVAEDAVVAEDSIPVVYPEED